MSFIPIVFLIYGVFALILTKVVLVITAKRHRARESARRGCLPAPTAPDKGMFGINLLRESIRATKDGWGPIWMHQLFEGMGENVHTVRSMIFDYELVVTRDPENAKAMFATQSDCFDIGPHREKCFKSLLGKGVMTGRGTVWKHSRGLIRPQFARDNVADLSLFQRHLNALLKKLPAGEDQWTTHVDLLPLFFNMTLDVGTEFLLGHSVHSQDPEARDRTSMSWTWNSKAPDLASFGDHLDKAKHIIDRRGAMAKYGWLLRDKAFPKHCKAVQSVIDYFVAERLGRDDEKSVESQSDGKFVLLDELVKETRDPLELRNELLNVLHASRDTTASLLSWTFYFLARHTDVFDNLRSQVIARFTENPDSEVNFQNLWSIPYMQHVLNEVIRSVGIVPMNERAATKDTTLPRGGGPDGMSPIFIAKGTQVLIPTYSMQHRKDIWGADVDEFKPERWQDRKFGWDFIPFGGGARQCLGQQFARTETMFMLVRILQCFDQIQNLDNSPLKMHHTIENRPWEGVQVRLHAVKPQQA